MRRRRCAIYTRKSTEEGLDQAFNSLDAQHEACAAYIVSQRHEGWMLHPGRYDDGGFTGGNMARPGLARLLDDVAAGRVDVVVVYKVDRLTRSLADFAKIVDVLDRAGASFVSITQAFNTTTSMGRLTLNVLLSFAQFEREVIAERVRDKVAASKAKGMWMGGPVPLGYDVRERKLIVNEAEAELVRGIMRRYLAAGSVRALIAELAADGIVTKRQRLRDGRDRGGVPFARGALYHLLGNRLYRGEIGHKGSFYPGEHDAIVEPVLFAAVQTRLKDNGVVRGRGAGTHPSLLAGMIHDAAGRPMSPSHASKGGRRYRYYVSNGADDAAALIRLPAPPLELAIVDAVRQLLATPDTIVAELDVAHLQRLQAAVRLLGTRIAAAHALDVLLRSLQLRVTVYPDRIAASIGRRALMVVLDGTADWTQVDDRIALALATSLTRRGHEARLRIDPAPGAAHRDDKLVAALVRGHQARETLLSAAKRTTVELTELRRAARLCYLAPDIVASILAGRQPRSLTARTLTRVPDLPICWRKQRALFGFA